MGGRNCRLFRFVLQLALLVTAHTLHPGPEQSTSTKGHYTPTGQLLSTGLIEKIFSLCGFSSLKNLPKRSWLCQTPRIMQAMTAPLPCRARSGWHAGIALWARRRRREFPNSPPDSPAASGRGDVQGTFPSRWRDFHGTECVMTPRKRRQLLARRFSWFFRRGALFFCHF